MADSTKELHLLQAPPPSVGAYWLGGYRIGFAFHLSRRPAWFHRTMMRWGFGWEWHDAE